MHDEHNGVRTRKLSSGYDIGCIYPEMMKDPFQSRDAVGTWMALYVKEHQMETPMVVRLAHLYTTCPAMCLSYHDPEVFDPLTNEPGLKVPAYGHNAWSISMCLVQCAAHVMGEVSDDAQSEFMDYARNNIGLVDIQHPMDHEDIMDATMKYYNEDETDPLEMFLTDDEYHPLTMGHVAGFRNRALAKIDGWNADGSLQYSLEDNEVVPCTGNCRKFQDTSGYAPVPDPRTFSGLNEDMGVYDCTGLCRRWQPLQEGNEVGSLLQQEFVVPHIGKNAHTFLREPTLTLSDPEYDLRMDSLQVIEEVKITSSDKFRKSAVKVFDDKLYVRSMIQDNVRDSYAENMSFQDYLLYLYGMSMAEYDGVIQAWHEKAEHDLVRPTTVIKHWDTDMLNTFGGNPNANGPVDILARDFEAFIRVMPHPEFPSGSSCLCTTYMEFTDLYLTSNYGNSLTNIVRDAYYNIKFNFTDMTDLRDHCSNSRVWAGIHYPEALPAGEQICSGLGQLGFDYVTKMKNDSNFGDIGPYYENDPRPICMI